MPECKTSDFSSKKYVQQKLPRIFVSTKRNKAEKKITPQKI